VLRMAQQSGDQFGIAQGLYDLANLAWEKGDFEQARVRYEELLEMAKKLGSKQYVAYSLLSLSTAYISLGKIPYACQLIKESVETEQEWSNGEEDPSYMMPAMLIVALARVAQGKFEQAAWLFSYANHSSMWNVRLMTPRQRQEYEEGLASASKKLGEEDFAAAWERGRTLTFEEVLALAKE
jgi:tetratricopeptide (TPR) repeat protein